MESAADVEKLQDVIRQLEVQNQKLRNRGTPNKATTSKSANNNDSLIDALDESISDGEFNSPSNFICQLSHDDYDEIETNPWASAHAYLRHFEHESQFSSTYAELEASRRYISKVGTRLCKKALKESKPAFDEYAQIEPIIVAEPITPIQPTQMANKRARSPPSMPRPSQARLRDERERSVSPQRFEKMFLKFLI